MKDSTIWEDLQSKGISRRDFLKICTYIAAMLGLEYSSVGKVVKALEGKKKLPVIWLHFQECTGCTESFIKASHPEATEIILDLISLEYHETLQAAAGKQAEEAFEKAVEKHYGNYVLVVEGSVPRKDEGVYCMIAGKPATERIKKAAAGAKAVITYGNCACFGGLPGASPNPTGAEPISYYVKDKPVVKVSGCPPIPNVMAGVVAHYLVFGRLPQLDAFGRPLAFYKKTVHDTCYRRPFFNAGLFVQSFDDEHATEGYCLYKMGCRGPATHNACSIIKWNEGISYPIQSGHGCIGCSEPGFWDRDGFYNRLSQVKLPGINATADEVGMVATGVTAAALLGHAIATNIAKRKELKEEEE